MPNHDILELGGGCVTKPAFENQDEAAKLNSGVGAKAPQAAVRAVLRRQSPTRMQGSIAIC